MRTERIEMLERLNQALSRASDVYEAAWTVHFENPTEDTKEKLEVAGMLVELATDKWLDGLEAA